jgi:hypothetical protein
MYLKDLVCIYYEAVPISEPKEDKKFKPADRTISHE